MLLSTVPPVDCKRGGGEVPELALARSDRFVRVLSQPEPLVEQPGDTDRQSRGDADGGPRGSGTFEQTEYSSQTTNTARRINHLTMRVPVSRVTETV